MPRGRPRCQWCRAPIAWFTSPFTGQLRKFDAKPVDGRTHAGAAAYPVEGRRAWKFSELVEELVARRETTHTAAEEEAYDMPWYVPHDCPKSPYRRDREIPETVDSGAAR